jgi:hypothetical protein
MRVNCLQPAHIEGELQGEEEGVEEVQPRCRLVDLLVELQQGGIKINTVLKRLCNEKAIKINQSDSFLHF